MKEFKAREDQDKSLRSGERQVCATLDGIEWWHKWRYIEALRFIKQEDVVIDLGCGCGYGSFILSTKAKRVVGIDDSVEAIDFAREHYSQKNITFTKGDLLAMEYIDCEVVVAYEVLEHVESNEAFFGLLKHLNPRIVIVSTPHTSRKVEDLPFHYRHYTEKDLQMLLLSIGYKIIESSTPTFSNGQAVFCVAERES